MDELKLLIQKAQKGDKEAFSRIYKLYFEKIYKYCKFNLNDDSDAQDACQETFVKAWRNIKKFDAERPNWSFQAFLFKIARNLIIDRSRRKKDLKIKEYIGLETNEDFYENIQKKQDVSIVRQALENLDEIERQIIILRFFEEMDTKEIANILGMKDGAIRVRLHRTMDKLKIITENLYGRQN